MSESRPASTPTQARKRGSRLRGSARGEDSYTFEALGEYRSRVIRPKKTGEQRWDFDRRVPLYGPFTPPQLSRYGFWSMASEARTDFAMLMSLLFLLIVGAGPWSLDALRSRRPPASSPTPV